MATDIAGDRLGGSEVTGYTYGKKLVGLDFNPSGDPKVAKLKGLFAEIADICHDELEALGDDADAVESAGPIWREAIMRTLDAQMWTVKGATWRK